MKNNAGLYTVITIGIAALLTVINHYGLVSIDPVLLLISRWIAISGLIYYAIRKKSLTTWILVSMVVGASIGHDVPDVAVNLRVLSQIFLKIGNLFVRIAKGTVKNDKHRNDGANSDKQIKKFRIESHSAPMLFI